MYKRKPDADPHAAALGSRGGNANTPAQKAARLVCVLAAQAKRRENIAARKAKLALDNWSAPI